MGKPATEKKVFLLLILGVSLVISVGDPRFLFADNLVIIVNKSNNLNELSLEKLKAIYRAEDRYWESTGAPIVLLMKEEGTREKDTFIDKVYKMNSRQLKKFWIHKLFMGETAYYPITLSTNDAIKKFVSQNPDAIGYMSPADLDNTVKALKINGSLTNW